MCHELQRDGEQCGLPHDGLGGHRDEPGGHHDERGVHQCDVEQLHSECREEPHDECRERQHGVEMSAHHGGHRCDVVHHDEYHVE